MGPPPIGCRRRGSEQRMAAEELNWSATLEDLLDGGNTHEALRLLEGLVTRLQAQPDAASNLTLSAALSDLASLYLSLGLSSLAHSASASSLLIKQTAQTLCPPPSRNLSSSNLADDYKLTETTSIDPLEAHQCKNEGDNSDCEDWEGRLNEGSINLEGLSLAKNDPEAPCQEKTVYRQRGRGVFTHGEMGMHIDRLATCPNQGIDQLDRKTEENEDEEVAASAYERVAYGVRHVLVVSFASSVTTSDLENLFEPFGSNGVAIRWVNDTTALAVFRNPETAKEALRIIRNPRFKLDQLADDDDTLTGLVKEQDLQPPVPRPATSSQAAHRMIMGALQRQGLQKKTLSTSTFRSSQQQESERKQRLLTRQKLRDEAWGSDD